MDLNRAIADLREEQARIDKTIESLSILQADTPALRPRVRHKRGRKFMTSEERLEVSARMRKYWAQRRETLK
jgi:hypothetical protein